MISKNEVKQIYKECWQLDYNLSDLEIELITNNINENMPQYISDEIKDYLENK